MLGRARLSTRLGAIIGAVGLVAFAAIALVISVSVHLEFSQIEQGEIAAGTARAQAVLDNLRHVVGEKTDDEALWNDAYDYLADGNAKFVEVNVHATETKAYAVDGMGYFRFDKAPRAVVYFRLADGRPEPDMVRNLRRLCGSDAFLAQARAHPRMQFFTRFGDRILAIATAHVTRSDGSGTPAGFAMTAAEVKPETVSKALQVPVVFDTSARGAFGYRFDGDDTIAFRIAIPGLDGRPIAAIAWHQKRSMMAASRNLDLRVIAGLGLLIVLMLVALLFALNRSIIAPLAALTRHVVTIGETGELIEASHDGRRDEIGDLAAGFNAMVAQLRDLRARMEAQSFQIGKSQSAIGSLHNVRNGLCPVTTLLSLVPADLALPQQSFVARAIGELGKADLDPARREQLAGFVSAALERQAEQLAGAQAKVFEANRAVAQVVDAIAAEQAAIQGAQDTATCNVTEVIAASLAIATYNDKGCPIAVEFAADRKRPVLGDRVLIAQVIGNVLTNAVEAIVAARREQGRIRITMTHLDSEGAAIERITITDNGDGFEPDRARHLFERGFSTRVDKHGGLGLHWCANTINAMGGTLAIASDGPGTGATITLDLVSANPAPSARAA